MGVGVRIWDAVAGTNDRPRRVLFNLRLITLKIGSVARGPCEGKRVFVFGMRIRLPRESWAVLFPK